MSKTRQRILVAAVTLVGERGVKALTHRRVDARAGLPEGSTSNHFRTKSALLQGAVEGVLLLEEPLVTPAMTVNSRDDLAAVVKGFVTGATQGKARLATAARLALFMEARHDPYLREQICQGRQVHIALVEAILRRLGSPTPAAGALAVVSLVEGLIVDMVTCAPEEEPGRAIELLIEAFVPLRA